MLATLNAIALTQATEFVYVSLEEVRILSGSFFMNALPSLALVFRLASICANMYPRSSNSPRINLAAMALTVSVVSQHSRTGPPPAHDVIDDAREFDAELA